MPTKLFVPFSHRWLSEGMIESTCRLCLATVCREPTINLVEKCEQAHDCQGPAFLLTDSDLPRPTLDPTPPSSPSALP